MAKRCLWCGVPIIDEGKPSSFEATRVEIDYLDGIERLDNPGPVRLVIDGGGIEVSEMMPGSRSIKIPADSLIQASVVDGSNMVEGKRVRSPWWWLALGPFAVVIQGKKMPDTKRHDYLLAVKYRSAGEERNAVFHREDRAGLSMVEGLARIINALVRLKSKESGGPREI
ncbi:MAG: hypothetical protein ACLGJB_13770 [Blastocatellia bacterium]